MAAAFENGAPTERDTITEELDLMYAALRNNDLEAARHHQFVALLMLNSLVKEQAEASGDKENVAVQNAILHDAC
ncbi:MAG TPA: hypothetical protein VH677_00190 [Nitrososphaera sp.]|jgi:hypothetical protein